jgi:hypothetical protein
MEAIALYFIDYVVKVSLLSKLWRLIPYRSSFIFITASLFSIGCALSAPDGSSPRGYSRKKIPGYRLKGYEFFLVHFITFSFSLEVINPRVQSEVFRTLFDIIFYYRLLCAEFTSFVNILWDLFSRRPVNMCL